MPQIPDDTFIINETSSGFSISGKQILQLEYTLNKENMVCVSVSCDSAGFCIFHGSFLWFIGY